MHFSLSHTQNHTKTDITLYINSPVRVSLSSSLLLLCVRVLCGFCRWLRVHTGMSLFFGFSGLTFFGYSGWSVCVFLQGGSVSAGMAVYDTMQYVPCDVATVWYVFDHAQLSEN